MSQFTLAKPAGHRNFHGPLQRFIDRHGALLKGAIIVLGLAAGLYLTVLMYAAGQMALAFGCVAVFALAFYVYLSGRTYAYRYMFPGLLGMGLFVLFPMVYTVTIGFTNYSSPDHLQTYERARDVLLAQTWVAEGGASYPFDLYPDPDGYRLGLTDPATGEILFSEPFVPGETAELAIGPPPEAPIEPLARREVIQLRNELDLVTVTLPDGQQANRVGLRDFATRQPLYVALENGDLENQQTGTVYQANFDTGFFESPDGERLNPGFRSYVGWENFVRTFTDPAFQGPFVQIFIWTVVFAGGTVFFSTIVGVTLACLLNWEALRFRKVYQALLFLPYAVPAFISILVFRGLFNQNFGEINLVLEALFGIEPAWFSNPWLAKTMILIVNTWLGYPYIMVLCIGLIQSIPSDLYEAAAVAGVGPWHTFRRITAPLLIRPLLPLLIASFSFNFNNFVLIALLTGGRPDIIGAQVPAGTTDILVSYTYRIAFEDSGRNFGLAAAISTLIFILVAVLAIVQIRLSRADQSAR